MAAPVAPVLEQVDPVDAWKPWQPDKADWSRKWSAHLFRRAGFGATASEAERAQSEGFSRTLDRLLTGGPDAQTRLEVFEESGKYAKNITELRKCWLALLLNSGHPLREKLTLFWHNHFATSIAKVRDWAAMREQNLLLRKHALGKFRPFLLEMSRDTAMLRWLDSNQNVKEAPNENYARELMELFSLGVGNYTENDIREAARAFTGWHTTGSYPKDEFEFSAEEHDEGLKTIFGQTGNWNGEDVVRLCCDNPACARLLVKKLYSFFVSETPPPRGLLVPLEEQFRASDYDIAGLVRTMLGSRLFFSNHAYRKRVKWPVEFVLEAVRTVLPEPLGSSLRSLRDLEFDLGRMGQALFAPPNVKGWRTGTDWLNSATLLARNNFSGMLAAAESRTVEPNPDEPIIRLPTGAPAKGKDLVDLFGTPLPLDFLEPPTDRVDPVARLQDLKPGSFPTLVVRMGELLFGQPLPAAQARRIERFFHEPMELEKAVPARQVMANYGAAPTRLPPPDLPTVPRTDLVEASLAPPPREVAVRLKSAVEYGFGSPEFNLRVREALHALMCSSEYQLN